MIICIKDSFSSRNSISNNDNMCSVLNLNCSINSAPNGKEFCFSRHYIHCMMNSFYNDVLTSVNVRDQGGNIVFDTSVQNIEDYVLVNEGILINVIKFDIIWDFCVSIFSINWIKRKTIIKSVYETKARWKFFIWTIKSRKYFIQVSVYYRTLDFQLLLGCKLRYRPYGKVWPSWNNVCPRENWSHVVWKDSYKLTTYLSSHNQYKYY